MGILVIENPSSLYLCHHKSSITSVFWDYCLCSGTDITVLTTLLCSKISIPSPTKTMPNTMGTLNSSESINTLRTCSSSIPHRQPLKSLSLYNYEDHAQTSLPINKMQREVFSHLNETICPNDSFKQNTVL